MTFTWQQPDCGSKMNDTPRLQTRYNLAAETTSSFQEIWMPPGVYQFNRETISFYEQCRLSGIPFNYLDIELEDYQSSDRESLKTVIPYISDLAYKWRSREGLVLLGTNGSGKSMLSYMIAKAAVRKGIRTTCLTLIEYLEKKRLSSIQSGLIIELMKQLNDSRIVVIDDFGKEYSGESNWTSYSANAIIYSIFSEGLTKSVIVNSSLSPEDFKGVAGTAISSRMSSSPMVSVTGDDFRENESVDLGLQSREDLDHVKCWVPHPVLSEDTVSKMSLSCKSCKYRFRPKLCILKRSNTWYSLKEESF